jgi:hypothetical protein
MDFFKINKNQQAILNHPVTIENNEYRVGDLWLVTTTDEKEHLCFQEQKVISQGGYNPLNMDPGIPKNIEPGKIEYYYHEIKKGGLIIDEKNIIKCESLANAVMINTKAEDMVGYRSDETIDSSLAQLIKK